ncbi:hypothetical protein GGU10DRAFT_344924 [Lentinula aff. detonsa]|uniref:Ubiquitin-like domain-containing protein n=1 Tax=Lentinula aff. detonsa TaxID=2804958 RepID=A0AA38KUN5_9AGAR|nr:hypothetical protein GGU10DRAFT_344924 [Lentinula aff. detonsa]
MPLPQKSERKIYQILVRTHKTTLFFTVPPSTTIKYLKEQVFSALNSGLSEEEGIPIIKNVEDFDLCRCRVIKGKDQKTYDVLEQTESTIKEIKLTNWEVLYIQFKDEEGQSLEIMATDPPIDDDEESKPLHSSPTIDKGKGKRRAIEDDDEYSL